jgi:hypothetical protein
MGPRLKRGANAFSAAAEEPAHQSPRSMAGWEGFSMQTLSIYKSSEMEGKFYSQFRLVGVQ